MESNSCNTKPIQQVQYLWKGAIDGVVPENIEILCGIEYAQGYQW